jgi:hypothetical protein
MAILIKKILISYSFFSCKFFLYFLSSKTWILIHIGFNAYIYLGILL